MTTSRLAGWMSVAGLAVAAGGCGTIRSAFDDTPPPPSSAPVAEAAAPASGPSAFNGHFTIETAALMERPERGGPTERDSGSLPNSAIASGPAAALEADGMESLSQITFVSEGAAFDPCVSRDGSFVVFAGTQHRATSDIYSKSINGRTVTQLTADPAHDVMPAISPDGKRIAFASNRSGSWDLYVMSAAGGQAVQMTSDAADELHPSWSSDGSRLVFSRLGEVSGRWEMWVTDAPGSGSGAGVGTSEFIGYGLFPSWCPVAKTGSDGRDRILFQRSRERGDRSFGVWTIDYKPGDASSPTEIAGSPELAAINPTWSGDGEWIAYATIPTEARADASGMNNAQDKPGWSDLWITDVAGMGRVNLTSGRFVNLMPSWGGDGRVYFVSNRGGPENIWSLGTEKAVMAARGTGMESSVETAGAGSEAAAETAETAIVEAGSEE